MKKKFIIGICVTSLILLVAPTIPAQQFRLVEESVYRDVESQINSLYNFDRKDFSIENIDKIKNNLDNIIESGDFDSNPTFIGFILSTIVSLIFAFFGTIFGIIFGPLLAILIQLLTAPAVILAKLISLIFGNY